MNMNTNPISRLACRPMTCIVCSFEFPKMRKRRVQVTVASLFLTGGDCKRWPAISGRPQVRGETALYAIRARGCVNQFTNGKVFHRQKRGSGIDV